MRYSRLPHVKSRHPFSLIELMIAVALGLIVLGMVSYTLNNTSKAVNKSTASVSLHARAQAIFQYIQRDMENILFAAPHTDLTGTVLTGSDVRWMCAGSSMTHPFDGSTPMDHDIQWVRYTLSGTELKRSFIVNQAVIANPGLGVWTQDTAVPPDSYTETLDSSVTDFSMNYSTTYREVLEVVLKLKDTTFTHNIYIGY